MSFGAPHQLFWLILPALIYFLMWRDLSRHRAFLSTWIDPKFWERLLPGWDPSARWRKAKFLCLGLSLAIIALARPQWGYREQVVRTSGMDLMIVLDVSRSMDVEDVVPSRMKKARHWIRSFVNRMAGNRIGVVAFAAGSHLACPLTTDLDYVLESIDILGPSSIINQGTDIGLGLSTALAAIERGAETGDDEERKGVVSKALILISDGEDHEAAFAEAASQIGKKGVKLIVLGVGTDKGGPIPSRDETGKLEGYKRSGSDAVISRFDSRSLERVAKDAGGRYWNISQTESEIDSVLAELGALEKTRFEEKRTRIPTERFQWPLGLAVLALVWELAIPLVRFKAGIAIVLLAFLSLPFEAKASPVESYLKNRNGIREYSSKKLDQAEQNFTEAHSADPFSAEPKFNLGVVQLNKGDQKSAVHSFESAAKIAGMDGDAALSARSLYNLGSAYEKGNQEASALKSFANAVRMAELAKDDALATDARKRIQKIQEQQQQQQQQQQKKNQEQGKQGGGGDSGQDQKSQQQEPQKEPQKYEDPSVSRRRPFKSEKLSPEDSERVMNELSSREKELQAKLKKQRGARQSSNDKDW